VEKIHTFKSAVNVRFGPIVRICHKLRVKCAELNTFDVKW